YVANPQDNTGNPVPPGYIAIPISLQSPLYEIVPGLNGSPGGLRVIYAEQRFVQVLRSLLHCNNPGATEPSPNSVIDRLLEIHGYNTSTASFTDLTEIAQTKAALYGFCGDLSEDIYLQFVLLHQQCSIFVGGPDVLQRYSTVTTDQDDIAATGAGTSLHT